MGLPAPPARRGMLRGRQIARAGGGTRLSTYYESIRAGPAKLSRASKDACKQRLERLLSASLRPLPPPQHTTKNESRCPRGL